MNYIARKYVCLFLLLVVPACAPLSRGTKAYNEIPPMFSVLTSVAQSAIEKGYNAKGAQAALEYITQKKPIIKSGLRVAATK